MKYRHYIIYYINKLLRRNYPCGRTGSEKHLCCRRHINSKTVFLSQNGRKAFCKFCGSIRIQSSHPIDLNNRCGWD